MNGVRTALGGVLLLGGLYVVVGEHISGTSADATINARTAVLRAPVEGRVEFAVHTIGSLVPAEEIVATISDDRFDNARLIDLERARASLETDAKRISEQIAAVTEARAILQAHAENYQAGRIRQIESRVAEAQAAKASAEARVREAESAFKRTSQLNDRGLQTNITLDRAIADYDVAKQDVERTRQQFNFLTTELASARDGVFIGDSYNDAPYSIQRIREFNLRLAELKAEADHVDLRLKQSAEQISAERVRVNRLTRADLSVDKPSIVWNFHSSGGEYVSRGQELVRLVDCTTTVITASVSETVYSTLKVGMPAQFRVNGDNRSFEATITRLAGSGAASLYENLTIGPSPEHLKRYDVTLVAPGIRSDPGLSCAVGRTGRVAFAGGPLSLFRQITARFGF
jgi:multidrug resistance efflux pump